MVMAMRQPPEDWQRLADHVRTARQDAGFPTRRALAEATGVTERTLGKLENGERVSADTLATVARAVGWPPDGPRRILAGGEPVPREPDRPRLEAVPGPLSAAQLPLDEPDAELLAAWGRSDETVGRLLALRNDAGTGPLPWKEKREFLLLLLRLRATGGSEEERERRQS